MTASEWSLAGRRVSLRIVVPPARAFVHLTPDSDLLSSHWGFAIASGMFVASVVGPVRYLWFLAFRL